MSPDNVRCGRVCTCVRVYVCTLEWPERLDDDDDEKCFPLLVDHIFFILVFYI